MLERFRDDLLAIEQDYQGKLFVANTQGLLQDKHWRNEIHPTPGGFKIIAKEVEKKIEAALH